MAVYSFPVALTFVALVNADSEIAARAMVDVDLAAVLDNPSEQTVQTNSGITMELAGATVTPRSVIAAQQTLSNCADWFSSGDPDAEPDAAKLRAIADGLGGDEVGEMVRLLRECADGFVPTKEIALLLARVDGGASA